MAGYVERRRRRALAPEIVMAAGIIVLLIGLYFIFAISGNTDKKFEKYTEELPGVVTESEPSGSKYLTTVEYTPGYSPMTVSYETKEQYEAGTEVTVKMEPNSFTHVYIEGMTPTGSADRTQGIIMALVGAVLAAAGFGMRKMRKAVGA